MKPAHFVVLFLMCLCVMSRQKMIRAIREKKKKKLEGERHLPEGGAPGGCQCGLCLEKITHCWSECSSSIVSCRDSLVQSAPSEHITFYCCLLAGNSFLARTILRVWFVFSTLWHPTDDQRSVSTYGTRNWKHTRTFTQTHKLIFIVGKGYFFYLFLKCHLYYQ